MLGYSIAIADSKPKEHLGAIITVTVYCSSLESPNLGASGHSKTLVIYFEYAI